MENSLIKYLKFMTNKLVLRAMDYLHSAHHCQGKQSRWAKK